MQKLNKALFGWMTSTMKINGKKLVPNNSMVLRFIIPLLFWVAAAVIICGKHLLAQCLGLDARAPCTHF